MMKIILILVILGALIGSSALNDYVQLGTGQDTSSDMNITKAVSNECEKGLIFGKVSKLTYFWGLIAFEAVRIHVITFNPFNFNTYLIDTRVSILNGYKGFLGNHSVLLWGEFSIIPPESNIINLAINERDSINLTLQWVIVDVPFIQREGISWSVLDVNNTNVTGTNITTYNNDEFCNMEGDLYKVQVKKTGLYIFCLTYEATGLSLFKSDPEIY